jgi:hypothetical protein
MKVIGVILLFISTILCGAISQAQETPTSCHSEALSAEESPRMACDLSEIKEQIAQQSQEFSQEMRQIKREIALLRQTMEKPGIKEIFAGIGYIFGLCGVAFYFSARKRGSDSQHPKKE